MASKAQTLKDKMKKATAGTAPSMVPVPYVKQGKVPEAPKAEEVIPDISALLEEGEDRETLEQLISKRVEIDAQIKPLEKQKDALTTRIKATLTEYGITHMMCAGAKVSYTETERKALNQMKLLEAGVSIQTLSDCTDITKSGMLKITPAKEAS